MTVDLRRAPLGDLRATDFRAAECNFPADGRAIFDRFTATWAGLDDPAWGLAGASTSDAGGPDWSYRDHVAHVAGWAELGVDITRAALESGRWPSDDEFGGGDFDRFNESLRERWAEVRPAEIRRRLIAATGRLSGLAQKLAPEILRGDDAWGWVYMTLHGHQLDHLGMLEPWSGRLRARQVEGDPFGPDPMRETGDAGADQAAFWAEEADVFAAFTEVVDAVPADRREIFEVTPTGRSRITSPTSAAGSRKVPRQSRTICAAAAGGAAPPRASTPGTRRTSRACGRCRGPSCATAWKSPGSASGPPATSSATPTFVRPTVGTGPTGTWPATSAPTLR